MGNHALLADVDVAVILIFVAGLGTAWMARGYNVQQCKIEAFAEKRKMQKELSKKRLAEMQKKLEAQKAASATSSTTKAKKAAPGTDHYGSIFAPTNLEAQLMIRELGDLNLYGGDLVEVAPPFDPTGNTALTGATLMFEILCVVAQSLSRR
ncbi:MAG TPA: hypothetical protein EYN63_07105 [Candidatus Lambdaproteobacteria bacterium]|nr:hypothetical protein [Candidatus Lambdaproteobacteria bacterium]